MFYMLLFVKILKQYKKFWFILKIMVNKEKTINRNKKNNKKDNKNKSKTKNKNIKSETTKI